MGSLAWEVAEALRWPVKEGLRQKQWTPLWSEAAKMGRCAGNGAPGTDVVGYSNEK